MGLVVIAGVGMVTALGCDNATSCAAARAGLVRSSVVKHYRMRSAVDGNEEPVIGYAASLLTHGFEREARLSRLAQGALTDLLARTAEFRWKDRPHRFYLSLPDPRRTLSGTELIADEAARRARALSSQQGEEAAEEMADAAEAAAEAEEAAADVEEAADGESEAEAVATESAAAERILAQAASFADWPGDASLGFSSIAGHVGGLEAIQAAVKDLESGAVQAAIVLAADSLLDEETLDWLATCDRLKCDASPAGLRPGEAGVAILLTADAGRGGRGHVRLQSLEISKEVRTLLSGASPTGEGLANVLVAASAVGTATGSWIISDQNGEVYRATDWGHALVRLRARRPAFAAPTIWHPAASFGDTGAASALVAVCIAAAAFGRNYAPAETALIASASDGEGRGALALGGESASS